jgi:putative DNA primase/helicase
MEEEIRDMKRVFTESGEGSRGGPVVVGTAAPEWNGPEKFKLTQLGNAERLIARYGQDLRYCHPWRRWLVWNGQQWRIDRTGEIERRANVTIRAIYGEAEGTENQVVRASLIKHAQRSETRAELEAMIGLARSLEGVPVEPEELDSDPWVLNCENGTLDLKKGKRRPHRRGDLITKLAPVEYDPKATCPVFMEFLNRIMDGDSTLMGYLQKIAGYGLSGIVSEKALFVLHGGGDNGKTTFLEALRAILGDYAGVVEIDMLMQNGQDSARERAVAELVGKRFVTSSETEEGQRMHEAKIKHLTGMGRLVGRHIYGSPFEFDPLFKLFIDANHKPVIRGTDNAIWNRIRLVPFVVAIPKEQQDKYLRLKLLAELPGILNWALQGCLAWQKEGLNAPTPVTDAVKQYREEMDLVADFIGECCETGPDFRQPFADLYADFKLWCEGRGEEQFTETAFGTRLNAKGYTSVRTSGQRYRQGLRLRESALSDGLEAA